ncbi:MAG: damage-inducible protein DinB [Brucellaceae bacterium]|nr:damage-inducible protein DinB [Brucellaceae bacterium]
MISAEYCQLLARYNHWQNGSLIRAADRLTGDERWLDRGAFFKSIAATFNHLYWADALQLERIKGNERPHETIKHSLAEPSDWQTFKARRTDRDEEIAAWTAALRDMDLLGETAWYVPGSAVRIVKPKALCVVQLFNHQTHHRGQIHAMLTAAGAKPDPTDLPVMPG